MYDRKFPRHQWPCEIRRKENCFRQPWMMTVEQLENCCGLKVHQFWMLVSMQRGSVLRDNDLDIAGRVLLFCYKMRGNPDFRELSAAFQITSMTANNIFWTQLTYYLQHNNSVPNIPTDSQSMDTFYQEMKQRENPFHKELLSYFADPKGANRIAVGISLDSKKVSIENSQDFECQKDCYYSKKGGHFVTFTSFVDTSGYIVYTLPVAAASSPRCGDSQLCGLELKRQVSEPNDKDMISLLCGTDKHFILLSVDKGYVFIPHNVNLTNVEILKEWCADNSCFLIWPSEQGDDTILQIRNSQIESVQVPDDPILTKNSRNVVGKLRAAVEQFHGAISQYRIISDKVPHQFLQPLGESFCNKYNIPMDFASTPRISLLWFAAVSLYNKFHPKFHHSYAEGEEQVRLAQLLKLRLNQGNFFHDETIQFPVNLLDFPREGSRTWSCVLASEIPDLSEQLNLPKIASGEEKYFLELSLGPYLYKRALSYITHLRQYEAGKQLTSFERVEDYWDAMLDPPSDSKIFYIVIKDQPIGWDGEKYFQWPDSGLTILTMKLPSANRSNRSKATLKMPLIAFGDTPTYNSPNYLGFTKEMESLIGWNCYSLNSGDSGARMTTADAHVLALLILIVGDRQRKGPIRRSHLTDPKLPMNLQPKFRGKFAALPTSTQEQSPRFHPYRRIAQEQTQPVSCPLELCPFKGFINDGNTCYCIAVIQCLKSVGLHLHLSENSENPIDESFIQLCGNGQPASVLPLIQLLNRQIVGGGFEVPLFHDAGEFLGSLLAKLDVPDEALSSWPLQLLCPSGHVSLQPSNDGRVMKLSVPQTGEVSLSDMYIGHFSEDQPVIRCPADARNRTCNLPGRGVQIFVPGATTILELNRHLDLHAMIKITTRILEPQIPLFQQQSLKAVMCHTGRRCDQGHWICFLKNGHTWWKMDDDHVPTMASPWVSQGDDLTINILFFKQD